MLTCNIFTGNHIKKAGIQDHIDAFLQLNDYGLTVSASNALVPNEINIIIEEFTDKNFIKFLHSFKSLYPKSVLVLAMTELPYKDELKDEIILNKHIAPPAESNINIFFRILMYNIRQLRNLLFQKYLFLYKTYIFVKFIKCVKFFKKRFTFLLRVCFKFFVPKVGRVLILKIIFNFLHLISTKIKYIFFLIDGKHKQLLHDAYVAEYMRERGRALSSVVGIFDCYVDFHPTISRHMADIFDVESITLFPRADFSSNHFLRSSTNAIVATGAVTSYRSSFLKQLGRAVHDFDIVTAGFPSDYELRSLGGFTINIPQTDVWPMSSPVRIARSLKAGLVPIVAQKFSDHPIENCSLDLQEFLASKGRSHTDIIKVVASNVEQYNVRVKSSFQTLAEKLRSFETSNVADNHNNALQYSTVHLPVFSEAYRGFNIVDWQDKFWAIPQSAGPIYLNSMAADELNYCTSASLEELRVVIDRQSNEGE